MHYTVTLSHYTIYIGQHTAEPADIHGDKTKQPTKEEASKGVKGKGLSLAKVCTL